jgi:hypothetical protein
MCGGENFIPGGEAGNSGINFGDPADLFGGQRRADAKRAADEAKATEAARQARISGNVKDINAAFNAREPQYIELGDALRARLNEGVQLQRENAERQSKFSLSRGGLIGGSAQRDASTTLNREGREATLAAEREAQKGVAGLRAADEDARARMISLAQSGNDIGNATAATANALKANLGTASSASNIANLGDLFGNTAATYRAQQDAAERRRGLTEAQTYAKPFSRGP